jgi:hypothetical protein
MLRFAAAFLVLAGLFSGTVFGQHAVDPAQRYHRLICLVHLTGTGTLTDPIRPEFVPDEEERGRLGRAGIIAWGFQVTDDGKMAIVHLVSPDRRAFARILADQRPEIRVFELGKHDRSVIETEMRKYKRDFDLDTLEVAAQ